MNRSAIEASTPPSKSTVPDEGRLYFIDKPAGVVLGAKVLNDSSADARQSCDRDRNGVGDGDRGRRRDGDDDDDLTLIDHLTSRFGRQLYACYDLPRDVSGTVCLSENSKNAAEVWQTMKQEKAEVRFHCLAQEKKQNPSPSSRLKLCTTQDQISLWEITAQAPDSTSVLKFAREMGLKILGDQGSATHLPTLCLHLTSVKFSHQGEVHSHASEWPRWLRNLQQARNSQLHAWVTGIERRERLARSLQAMGRPRVAEDGDSVRLLHSEGDPLRVDRLGPVHWVSWFKPHSPKPSEWQTITQLMHTIEGDRWILQIRGDRGRDPNTNTLHSQSEDSAESWTTQEEGVTYEMRRNCSSSPGLFLDQRKNRLWVRHHSKGKDVLNLFSYSGSFSVCAALGGANKVVSVDLSSRFLEWSKANFTLNDIPIANHEFRTMDCRRYLDWALKKKLRFDLIICDPPSFGRSKDGVFNLNKDLPSLLSSVYEVTKPGGRALLSCNFESWSMAEFQQKVRTIARERKLQIRILPTPEPDLDFELVKNKRNMKSLFVTRI